jgi:hypothetical protein
MMLRFFSRQVTRARAAKSRLKVVILNAMLLSLYEVIKMGDLYQEWSDKQLMSISQFQFWKITSVIRT